MYSRSGTRDQDYAALVGRRYGAPPPSRVRAKTRSVQMTVDTGEEILLRPVEPDEEEYVVDRPEPPADLVPPAPPAPPTPIPPLEPPQDRPVPPPVEPPPATPMPVPPSAPAPAQPAPVTPEPMVSSAPAALPAPAPTPASSPAADGASGLTSADLAADMQAILGGGLVYDQSIGKVRPRTDADPAPASARPADGAAASAPSAPVTPVDRPLPDAPDEQSIFDRIAMSMEHANSFDLGTHELQRRFDVFERVDQGRRTPRSAPMSDPMTHTTAPATAPGPPPPAPATPGPVAGLRAEDFAAVYERPVPGRSAGCAGSGATAALAPRTDDQRSVPMYDTGEHVMTGGDLYPDRLVVGTAAGVPFSYGQLIAMPDFYATVDDLLRADPAELNRLKALIQRNTAYYVGNKADPSGNVENEEWDRATGDRYMRLAESNFDHFAPAALLGLPGTQSQSDHKRRWEELHRRALAEMQALVLATTAADPFPMGPLTVNAFADHFLTDAFAAGHLVNKELLMERFRSRFFSGSSLTADANRFFDQVADRAWTDKVRGEMSRLEPTSPPDALCAGGLCLPLHPNIRTAGMFAEVLKQAAVAEPAKISNLAVKVLHDKLNREGVDVVNDAGDAWPLKGDGHMTRETLTIMRRAVDQSVANVNDPVIRASNANLDPLVARVWRFTPRPTPAARVLITRAVDTYTDPRSAEFVRATADLINEQIDVLVKALVASGRMQRGGGI